MRGSLLVAGTALLLGCATLGEGGGGNGGAGASGGGRATSGGDAVLDHLMPDLVLEPLNGRREIRLAALRGKVVLLDVWASWCAPCRQEMPLLDDLARRLLRDGVNGEVVAVSIDEDRASAERFLRARRKWTLTLAHDPRGTVADRLKPPAMPSTYLIDGEGRLREINAGFEPGDITRLEARLRALAARQR